MVVWTPHEQRRLISDVIDCIIVRIVQGERLHKACAAEGTTWHQFWRWKEADAQIAQRYARAREASAESWEDKATDAAEQSKDFRLQEANARWRASVANPTKFGNKVDLTTAGARIGIEELVAGSMALKPGET